MRPALLSALSAVALVLHPSQLEGVKSIACLQLLLRDPTADCAQPTEREASTPAKAGQWFIGTGGYPVPDAVTGVVDPKPCSSGGEYFCDPDGVLTPEQQAAVQADLRFVRENTLVSCPIPGRRARSHADQPARPDDELNYLLGVAIVGSLPPTETDQESLQKFGDSVLDSWRLSSNMAGEGCDRSALLIVVADAQAVWVHSRTCRWVCGAADPGEKDSAAGLEAGERVLAALSPPSGAGDWGARLQNAIRVYTEVLQHRKDVERSAVIPKETRMSAYLRRKEKEWRALDTGLQYTAIVVVVLVVLGTFAWHWAWVREAVPYGASKLASDQDLFGGVAWVMYRNLAALVLIVPLLLLWTLSKAWDISWWAGDQVLHGVYSTGHAALDAGMAGLAVVTEPCLRLAEPAETAMDAAVGVDA